MTSKKVLTITDHNRDVSGYQYIYPVVSRRAGGVSIGINLNTNNACNWRCIYCNVPNLSRGGPPPIDLILLKEELRTFINDVLYGDFMQTQVQEHDRQLKDIAFSGNGEPTSAKEFSQAVALVSTILSDFNLRNKIKVRLITNGSMLHKAVILDSLKQLAAMNGEVWFKLDAGTKADIARVNDVTLDPKSHLERLKACANVCPTLIQTCLFAFDGEPPSEKMLTAYIDAITQVKDMIQGVHLYGIARQSMQVEANRLSALPVAWLESFAVRLRKHDIQVFVNP